MKIGALQRATSRSVNRIPRRWKQAEFSYVKDFNEAGKSGDAEDAVSWTRDYLKNLNYDSDQVKKGRGGVLEELPDQLLRIGIFGSKNMGKTTLFNLFLHPDDRSIELNLPGVTSDAKSAEGSLGRMYFTIIDTPPIIEGRITDIHEGIISSLDIALVVTNARGTTANCELIADWIRLSSTPAILVANFTEENSRSRYIPSLSDKEITTLNLGPPLYISAKEKKGISLLQDVLAPYHAVREAERKQEEWELEDRVISGDKDAADDLAERRRHDRPINVAIVGKFNAGKSTLFNSLLGQDRHQVTDTPGTTRDSASVTARYFGLQIRLQDTPGFEFRKKGRWAFQDPSQHPHAKKERITHWMHTRTLVACKEASVIIFVIDARVGFTRRERVNLDVLFEMGRPIIVVANKWDEVTNKDEQVKLLEMQVQKTSEVKHLTIVCSSAKERTNMGLLMETVIAHYKRWHVRVSSGKLNKFWQKTQSTLRIPYGRSKGRFLNQVASSPPTFAVFLTKATILQGSLAKFLINRLRQEFSLNGIPIRLIQRRKPANVYSQLGYTPPTRVYGNPPNTLRIRWKQWESGATSHNVRRVKQGRTAAQWETTSDAGYTG